jgi:tRNA(Arg) A34 adenosine deaminase TadA
VNDRAYLQQALKLSELSPEPTGCGVVIVSKDGVIASEFNSQQADNIAVYHAEIKAIIEANKKTDTRKLEGTTAYCSCEPCAMCLTALSYAKVARIVFYKRMIDLFPEDTQSQLDPYAFIASLNFSPQLERMEVKK